MIGMRVGLGTWYAWVTPYDIANSRSLATRRKSTLRKGRPRLREISMKRRPSCSTETQQLDRQSISGARALFLESARRKSCNGIGGRKQYLDNF